MRELFDIRPPDDPVDAARRGARPALRRRFYESATVAATPHGHAVRLDDKPVSTPARRVLAAPTMALAQAIAAEWSAQTNVIDPATMPLTRLANAILDGVADAPQQVADEIGKYLASDLLFYRAASPPGLVELQAQHWDPVLIWARDALGAHFEVGGGRRSHRAARRGAESRQSGHPEGSLATWRAACCDYTDRIGTDCYRDVARKPDSRHGVASGSRR